MRPPSDYAPPDAPIRRPIDLSDDFGTEDANRGDLVITGIAAAILLLVVVFASFLLTVTA